MIEPFLELMFFMIAGHAYADFALQGPWHSSAKYPGNEHGYPWQVGLLCHGLIHGGIVGLVTGSWLLGTFETISHAMIDYGKSRGWYGNVTDQLAHITCKIIWACLILGAGFIH